MSNKEYRTSTVILLSVLASFLILLMLTISWVWGTYNTLIVARQDLDTQFSNMKTEYQRRADLIFNMVEVVKGYADFEKDTLTQVTQARSGNFGATKEEQMNQLNELDSVFARLLLVFERYPDLKAIQQYNKLTEELQRTENRVQIARSDYNSLVRSYNILVQKFPTNILASGWDYNRESFFENKIGTEEAPKIDMS